MRIMVGIDDSDESFHALQWVLDNLSSGLNAPPVAGERAALLTLVHVHQPFQPMASPELEQELQYFIQQVDYAKKSQEQISAGILSLALQMCGNKMIKAQTLIIEGNPKVMICEISEEMNVDLLLVGSRGLGKIKRVLIGDCIALLGSVSDYCAHHAKCPTLIVKPPKEATVK